MLYSGTDPESYITEYTLVYEDKFHLLNSPIGLTPELDRLPFLKNGMLSGILQTMFASLSSSSSLLLSSLELSDTKVYEP